MVSFTGACPISAREGEAMFWITLYISERKWAIYSLLWYREAKYILQPGMVHIDPGIPLVCSKRFSLNSREQKIHHIIGPS